ncbi:MAG TPA: insulinase family protein, partial [Polyangiaceae bacterium]|nr:insulinase family protein [Polyangiaceae bacterium]
YSSLTVDRRRHAFSVWTFPRSEDAAACVRHQIEMLQRWREDGITQEELERAQRYLIRSHVFAIDTPAKRVGLALDEALHGLSPGYYARYRERVRGVSREEANAAIRRRIDLDALLVVVLGTAAVVGGPVRDAIEDLQSAETVPFDDDP